MARLTAQAVLFAATRKSATVELAALPGLIRESAAELADAADALVRDIEVFRTHPDHDSYQLLAARSDDWMRQAAAYCEARDPLLDLSQSVPHGDQRVLSAEDQVTRTRATA